jgi:cytochrome P450
MKLQESIVNSSDDDLDEYLDCVIKESARLHPVTPVLVKKALKDTHLDGFSISEKTIVFVDVTGAHTDKRHWGSDANQFNPERWANGFKPVEGSYLPFGMGSTAWYLCDTYVFSIGKAIACSILKVLLVEIIKNWDVELEPDQSFNEAFRVTVGFNEGLFARLKRRVL